jgi:NDP-sugar pyrophosphorylase family protein
LLEQDVAFYGHEITDYWNDIGNIPEFRQGNFDALTGQVRVELECEEPEPGLLVAPTATISADAIVEPPVFVGSGSEVGPRVRLSGPVVIGDGSRIGAGAAIRESVLWPRCVVDEHEVLIGAVAGDGPLAERL